MAKDNENETPTYQNSLRYQVAVLKALSSKAVYTPAKSPTKKPTIVTKALKINEIAELSGIKDEKETTRYLFILEGQRMVSPQPEGDLTSRNWNITAIGLKTVEHLSKVQQK